LRSSSSLLVGLLVLPLLAPAASAATGVHVSWVGDGYDVAFSEPAGATPSGSLSFQPASHVPGDSDTVYWGHLPPSGGSYTVDGRTFTVAARPGPSDTVRIAFLADWGRETDSWKVLDQVIAQKPDLVIVGGDLSYANGVSAKWDDWFTHIEPLAARVPVMVALGNHEALCADAQGDLAPCEREQQEFDEHIRAPSSTGPPHTYAFDWGPARFLALDTEAYHVDETQAAAPGDAHQQADYARAALASTPSDEPWRIAYYHRSPYSSNTGDGGSDTKARDALLPILQAGGVQLSLSGHVHAYERTYQLQDGNVVGTGPGFDARTQGIVFVDSGGGGRSLYGDWTPAPAWSAVREATFELTLLTISPDTLDVKAIRQDGTLLDHFTVFKNGCPTTCANVPGIQQSLAGKRVPEPSLALAIATALVVTLSRRRSHGPASRGSGNGAARLAAHERRPPVTSRGRRSRRRDRG